MAMPDKNMMAAFLRPRFFSVSRGLFASAITVAPQARQKRSNGSIAALHNQQCKFVAGCRSASFMDELSQRDLNLANSNRAVRSCWLWRRHANAQDRKRSYPQTAPRYCPAGSNQARWRTVRNPSVLLFVAVPAEAFAQWSWECRQGPITRTNFVFPCPADPLRQRSEC